MANQLFKQGGEIFCEGKDNPKAGSREDKEEGDQDPLKDERWKSNFAREFSQNHRYRTQYEVSVIQGEAIRVAASITTRASS